MEQARARKYQMTKKLIQSFFALGNSHIGNNEVYLHSDLLKKYYIVIRYFCKCKLKI